MNTNEKEVKIGDYKGVILLFCILNYPKRFSMDQFLQDVFNKAKEESGEKSLRKWSEHIADYLADEIKYPLSVKTIERYYNGETQPNMEKKNNLAMFLGYKNYKDYLNFSQEYGQEKGKNNSYLGENLNTKKRKNIIIVLGFVFMSILGAGYLGYSSGSEECMIWNKDHYEVTVCEGKNGETEKIPDLLENFKEIQVSDTTTFFKNGRPLVWYDKHENELYFFNAPGINPETGKTVKEITEYMINKYIKTK